MTLRFALDAGRGRSIRVLCIGAHSDDIEIGCGGTVLKLLQQNPRVSVTWVVLSGDGPRAQEARRSAGLFLRRAARTNIETFDFRTSYFPTDLAAIKDVFETFKAVNPDLIFTHTREDLHQDHRVVCELTWNTFRRHTILEYEVPKYDGDTGAPNVFTDLNRSLIDRKAKYLMTCFGTQRDKHWFTADLFTGLARLRGVQCAAPGGFAEGFYGRKLSLL